MAGDSLRRGIFRHCEERSDEAISISSENLLMTRGKGKMRDCFGIPFGIPRNDEKGYGVPRKGGVL
ncbi:MAG: hypothetical protein ACPLPS_07480 [bacterium]